MESKKTKTKKKIKKVKDGSFKTALAKLTALKFMDDALLEGRHINRKETLNKLVKSLKNVPPDSISFLDGKYNEVCEVVEMYKILFKIFNSFSPKKIPDEDLDRAVEYMKKNRKIPILSSGFEQSLVSRFTKTRRRKKTKVRKREGVVLSLDPMTREKLEKYFRKKINEEEPLLVLDDEIQKILDRVIDKNLDRFIKVATETSRKDLEYGYSKNTNQSYNQNILKNVKGSIDWLLEKNVIYSLIAKEEKN